MSAKTLPSTDHKNLLLLWSPVAVALTVTLLPAVMVVFGVSIVRVGLLLLPEHVAPSWPE